MGAGWCGVRGGCSLGKICRVDDWAEADLAWELVETIGSSLSDSDRAAVCATIGAGNSHAAIVTLLEVSAATGCALPSGLLRGLADWLDAYRYSSDAARLRQLIQVIEIVDN